MKKAYSKPDILFDSFTMAQSIAACEIQATAQRNTCGVEMSNSITLFTSDVSDCNWIFEDKQYDGLCYHVPLEAYNVFGS